MKNILPFGSHFKKINENESVVDLLTQILEDPMEAPILPNPAGYEEFAAAMAQELDNSGAPVSTQDFLKIMKYFGRPEIRDEDATYRVYKMFTDTLFPDFAIDKNFVYDLKSKVTPDQMDKILIAYKALGGEENL